MKIKVILHNKTLLEKNCTYLQFKNEDGEVGVLKDHVPIILLGKKGFLKVKYENKKEEYISYKNGIFKFYKNDAILLASIAAKGDNITESDNLLNEIMLEKKRVNQKEQIDFSKLERELLENIKNGKAGSVK